MEFNYIDSEICLKRKVGALKLNETASKNLLADFLGRVFAHLVAESVQSILQQCLGCRSFSVLVECIFDLLKCDLNVVRHLWYGDGTSKVA